MINLSLDGECHNGKLPVQVDNRHWQFEIRGDDRHYCYYFHATLSASEPGEALVDILPDSKLLPESARSFRLHQPETVWICRNGGPWQRHPVEPSQDDDRLRLRLPMTTGESIRFSRMYPVSYSIAIKRLEWQAGSDEARIQPISIGSSEENREIAAVKIGTGDQQIIAIAGQHPAEFSGAEAVLGIAEWLLSGLPEAKELARRYRFLLVPVINPDGNVQGRCGQNGRGVNLYEAFGRAADGEMPQAKEARCLWDRVRSHSLALSLNFHTYTQPSPGGNFPWEGLYTPPDEAFEDPVARARQRHLDNHLAWETDGLSHSGAFNRHRPESLEYQLARLGIPSVFYELQDVAGPFRHRRTGVQVLRAALRSLEDA